MSEHNRLHQKYRLQMGQQRLLTTIPENFIENFLTSGMQHIKISEFRMTGLLAVRTGLRSTFVFADSPTKNSAFNQLTTFEIKILVE